MSNTVLIKEVNKTPFIFNVDNLTDEAALEALQALKMPASMASSIFGNRANNADNKTCIITPNPENSAFPFTVAFDASKIPAKPKRQTGIMAGLAMPSDYYIDVSIKIATQSNYEYFFEPFTAPANGYMGVSFDVRPEGVNYAYVTAHILNTNSKMLFIYYDAREPGWMLHVRWLMPMLKNQTLHLSCRGILDLYTCRFIYAQGEI